MAAGQSQSTSFTGFVGALGDVDDRRGRPGVLAPECHARIVEYRRLDREAGKS